MDDMHLIEPRSAAAEASAVLNDELAAAILEPSPPTVDDGDWFADDPVQGVGGAADVVPDGVHRPGATTWSSWLQSNDVHRPWVESHWLGGNRSLPDTGPALVETRLALHRLATYVIAPVRHQANGKFGLRWTAGGFGTPFFGDDRQIRVVGTTLVDQQAGSARTTAITTLAAAADFLETEIDATTAAEHDSPPVGDADEPLAVDATASQFLGSWFGMGFAALEAVRSDPASVNPSRPQLWPGHFDPAIEIGDDDHRASYGCSPGDDSIDEPYLYVSVWWPDRLNLDTDDPSWNAPSFVGSVLRLSEFPAGDPATAAAAFFAEVRDRLHR